ncbi:MAG: hypothetical protein LBT81_02345, partial [Helicobacteraceae bacterium]|nr:hypothetical protein [Helicobacteraceae bacterium]
MAKPTFYQLQIERLREGYEAAMGNALKGKPNSFQYSIGYFVGRAVKGVRDAVISLAERISTLEAGANRRYPVHLGTAALAQADYQAAYEAAVKQPAGSIPPNGSTL